MINEQEIKMFEKAVEIQEGRKLVYGDWYTHRHKDIKFTYTPEELIGEYLIPRIWDDHTPITFGKYQIWLPTQEQLQGMVKESLILPSSLIELIYAFDQFLKKGYPT